MDRTEAYGLLMGTMNDVRDQATGGMADPSELSVSKSVLGQDGRLYLIEVLVTRQPDGQVRLDGKASDHNPHNFQLVEESFFA